MARRPAKPRRAPRAAPTPLDLAGVSTYPLRSRRSKVTLADFARPHVKGASVSRFLEGLPRILGGLSFRALVRDVLRARKRGRPIVWGLGAHVIKVGLSPVIVALMERGLVTIGMTGQGGGKLAGQVDYLIDVPSAATPRIQEVHAVVIHVLCAIVEEAIAG